MNENYIGLRDTEMAFVSTSILVKVSSNYSTLTDSAFRTPPLPVVSSEMIGDYSKLCIGYFQSLAESQLIGMLMVKCTSIEPINVPPILLLVSRHEDTSWNKLLLVPYSVMALLEQRQSPCH